MNDLVTLRPRFDEAIVNAHDVHDVFVELPARTRHAGALQQLGAIAS
jgi:hypothetical protein